MRDIDPHWQSTEPTVIGGSPKKSAAKRATASRRPAALVGILFVTALGVAMYTQWSPLQGDIQNISGTEFSSAGTSIDVIITEAGLEPRKITAAPGQTVTWNNTTGLPHIFESKDIKDSSEQSLYSPAIFPGSKQSFTISSKQAPGTYTYASVTSTDITGEIEILGGAMVTSSASSMAILSDDSLFPVANENTSSSAGAAASSMPSSIPKSNDPLLAGFTLSLEEPEDVYAPPTSDDGLVPTNPYAIGSTKAPPPSVPTVAQKKPTNTNLHSGAPLVKPKTQPASGANAWMIALIATTVLATGYLLMPRKKTP